jgi:phenylalanyl-tRNA synthetase beta chain
MLVSWKWLEQYVRLDMSVEELTDRLTMSGLNLEEYQPVGDDTVIDLEVTSNRPDCLGHLGVAREVAVLFHRGLCRPSAQPRATGPDVAERLSVVVESPDLCPQYLAHVVRGVTVGPSPAWLRERLAAIGVASVNNVVDITNYVMFECGQPLHAFDEDTLRGSRLVIRRARAGETITAINQRSYALTPTMCVIADAERPVALAGVMGGFETEISSRTRNVVIEAASFAPLSIRSTARQLDLHSAASYRFERALDPQGPLWAARRCCELLLEIAGGTLCAGMAAAGTVAPVADREVTLRFAQLRRVLGIEIPADVAVRILQGLELQLVAPATASEARFRIPSHRGDLSREIDLVEEVGRVHGYHHLPANVTVPLCTSSKSAWERLTDRVGESLIAAGYFEAMTVSFTSEGERRLFQPDGDRPALWVEHSSRKHENQLRQSLVPSLLMARSHNERHGQHAAQLFEMAKVYLVADPDRPEREVEPWRLAVVTPGGFHELKGILQSLVERIAPTATLSCVAMDTPEFTPGRGARLLLNDQPWGWLGELSPERQTLAELRDAVCVAEVDLAPLGDVAQFVPRVTRIPEQPAMQRDLNFVLAEDVTWQALAIEVERHAGPLLEQVRFAGQFRGPQLGAGKKSYVVSLTFRAANRTLTSDEVDTVQQQIVAGCSQALSATLRA